jgi:hypothetical protein
VSRARSRVPKTGRTRAAPNSAAVRATTPHVERPPLSFRHPATWIAIVVAVAGIVLSVSNRLDDTDFWQHLVVGKAIAQLHRIPTTQIWTWPTFGAPDVNYAWGFEALVWPFWHFGGIPGLFLWRWLTSLLAFGILWAAARRMGARGFVALPVLVLCSLVYRQRSDIRPETVAAVLFALEIWILESRRHADRDRTWALMLIACAWANVHISFLFGLAYLGIHALAASFARRDQGAPPAPGARMLWLACLGWLVVSLLNPFGWKVLTQPFEYFFVWRNEPIYRTIGELFGIDWRNNLRNGTPLLIAGWPLLALWRMRRRGFDLVEALTCAMFIYLAFSTQRFLGNLAIASAAYVARDFDELLATARRPAWALAPGLRGTGAALACALVGLPLWTWWAQPITLNLKWKYYPVRACDFVARHGIRGRPFNHFEVGGYMLWRFWPERDRLPFLDIHQAGTRDDRLRYQRALESEQGWRAAEDWYHFDYILIHRVFVSGQQITDVLDHDSTWVPVFMDDAATVYLKRDGRFASIAQAYGYRVLPAGPMKLARVGRACISDSLLRGQVTAELERMIAESPWNAVGNSLLANLAVMRHDYAGARAHLEHTLAVDPVFTSAHERIGEILVEEGRPLDALPEYRKERKLGVKGGAMDLQMGIAWQRLGELGRARAAYRRALATGVGADEASDSLAVIERGVR